MSEPDSESEKPTKSRGGCGCLGLVMLLVGYILSPVPLVMFYEMMPPSVQPVMGPVLDVLFWPLQWCHQHSSVVEAFYDWYGELFDF